MPTMFTAWPSAWQVLFTATVPSSCGGPVSVYILLTGSHRSVSYVERVLRLDAFAACGERGECAGYLKPLSKVRFEFETDVGFGVVALSVPGRGNGVERF